MARVGAPSPSSSVASEHTASIATTPHSSFSRRRSSAESRSGSEKEHDRLATTHPSSGKSRETPPFNLQSTESSRDIQSTSLLNIMQSLSYPTPALLRSATRGRDSPVSPFDQTPRAATTRADIADLKSSVTGVERRYSAPDFNRSRPPRTAKMMEAKTKGELKEALATLGDKVREDLRTVSCGSLADLLDEPQPSVRQRSPSILEQLRKLEELKKIVALREEEILQCVAMGEGLVHQLNDRDRELEALRATLATQGEQLASLQQENEQMKFRGRETQSLHHNDRIMAAVALEELADVEARLNRQSEELRKEREKMGWYNRQTLINATEAAQMALEIGELESSLDRERERNVLLEVEMHEAQDRSDQMSLEIIKAHRTLRDWFKKLVTREGSLGAELGEKERELREKERELGEVLARLEETTREKDERVRQLAAELGEVREAEERKADEVGRLREQVGEERRRHASEEGRLQQQIALLEAAGRETEGVATELQKAFEEVQSLRDEVGHRERTSDALREEVTKLEGRCSSLTQQIDALRAAEAQAVSRSKEVETRLTDHISKLRAAEAEALQRVRETEERREVEREGLEGQLREAARETESVRLELRMAQDSNRELQNLAKDLEGKVEEGVARCRAAEERSRKVEAALRDELRVKEEQLGAVSKGEMERMAEQFKHREGVLEAKVKAAEKRAVESEEACSTAEQAANRMRRQLEQSRAELLELGERCRKQERLVREGDEALQAATDAASMKERDLAKQIAALSDQLATSRHAVTSKNAELRSQEERVAELEAKVAQHRSEAAAAKEERERALEEVAMREREAERAQWEAGKEASREKEKLLKALDNASAMCAEAKDEISRLQQKLADSEKARRAGEMAERHVAEVLAAASSLKEEHAALRDEHKAATQRATKAEEEAAGLSEQLSVLHRQAKEAAEGMVEAATRATELEAENAFMHKQVEERDKEIAALRTELEELKAEKKATARDPEVEQILQRMEQLESLAKLRGAYKEKLEAYKHSVKDLLVLHEMPADEVAAEGANRSYIVSSAYSHSDKIHLRLEELRSQLARLDNEMADVQHNHQSIEADLRCASTAMWEGLCASKTRITRLAMQNSSKDAPKPLPHAPDSQLMVRSFTPPRPIQAPSTPAT